MSSDSHIQPPEYHTGDLSPVSPKPVHLPSPANIPVLTHQIDPAYNEIATHMDFGRSTNAYSIQDQLQSAEQASPQVSIRAPQEQKELDGQQQVAMDLPFLGAEGYGTAATGGRNQISSNQEATLANQDSNPRPEVTSIPLNESSEAVPAPDPASQYPPTSFPAPETDLQPVAAAPPTLSHANPAALNAGHGSEKNDEATSGLPNGGEGRSTVDVQALLDRLTSATPSANASSSGVIATTTSNTLSNAPAPVPVLASPPPPLLSPVPSHSRHATLPPRPPPQEKPATHPNYTPNDDIRSYHPHNQQTPSQSQSLHVQTPGAVFRPHPSLPPPAMTAGAPGTSSTSSTLPPPPGVSFAQIQQAQQSPTTSEYRQRESLEGQRSTQDPEDSERKWGAEIQRKYDQFLEEERKHVTEGTWDKFPPNSRLFIGTPTNFPIWSTRFNFLL